MSDKDKRRKGRPFELCLDQELAALMANCRHSACDAIPISGGSQAPMYVCRHPKRRRNTLCLLTKFSTCLLRDEWFDHERIEVA